MIGGISLIALASQSGKQRKSDEDDDTYKGPKTMIDAYNTKTNGYTEDQLDALGSLNLTLAMESDGDSAVDKSLSFLEFQKMIRNISLVGEISRVATPNPATSFMLRSTITLSYPSSAERLSPATLTLEATDIEKSNSVTMKNNIPAPPSLPIFRRRVLGSFICRTPSGCLISKGQSYCVATYGKQALFSPPPFAAQQGGQCANTQACGTCYIPEYLDCFAVVLKHQKQKYSSTSSLTPNPTPSSSSSNQNNLTKSSYIALSDGDLYSCDSFSPSLNYRIVPNTTTNGSPFPLIISAVVALDSDPLLNAYRFSSQKFSNNLTFGMVDSPITKSEADSAENQILQEETIKWQNLRAPGIGLLVFGIILTLVGFVGRCWCTNNDNGKGNMVTTLRSVESNNFAPRGPLHANRGHVQHSQHLLSRRPVVAFAVQPHQIEDLHITSPPMGFVIDQQIDEVREKWRYNDDPPAIKIECVSPNFDLSETRPPSFADNHKSYQQSPAVFALPLAFSSDEEGISSSPLR